MERTYLKVLGLILIARCIGLDFNHNAIYLTTGLLALLAGFEDEALARQVCLLSGVLYGVVLMGGVFGWFNMPYKLNIHQAENVLNLAIVVSALYFGFAPARARERV